MTQELALETVQSAIDEGARFLHNVAHVLLPSPGSDWEKILYRQEILKNCLKHTKPIAELFRLAVEAIAGKNNLRVSISMRYPPGILRDATMMRMLIDFLKQLKYFADAYFGKSESKGLPDLMSTLQRAACQKPFV